MICVFFFSMQAPHLRIFPNCLPSLTCEAVSPSQMQSTFQINPGCFDFFSLFFFFFTSLKSNPNTFEADLLKNAPVVFLVPVHLRKYI